MTTGPLIDRRTTLALGLATSLPAGMASATAVAPSL